MKVGQLFPRKRPGRIDRDALFTTEQAAANLELLLQHLREDGLEDAANVYFCDFYVGAQRRNWLLPGVETVAKDLKPSQVDHALKHYSWYKTQLKKTAELLADNLPYD